MNPDATWPVELAIGLTDHSGDRVDLAALVRGTSDPAAGCSLVLFGFTHCKVVCPRALARHAGVLDRLADAGMHVRGLYISVDPQRDSPEAMRRFLEPWPVFTGLTGSVAAIDRVKASFRVFARRAEDPHDPGGYRVPHTAIAYLLAPDGRCLAHFADALGADEVVARLRALLLARGSVDARAPGAHRA